MPHMPQQEDCKRDFEQLGRIELGVNHLIEGLDRIEQKLDILINALAEDDAPEGPINDLDGNPLPSPRDESETL